jgi:flagellar biosynthesis GTPase FlhF
MEKDQDLANALKLCKSKEMFFAFIPKGPSDGKLIIAKKKIPAKDIAAAKKEIGGAKPITGKCSGALGEMVFETASAPPGTLAKAIAAVAKKYASVAVKATCKKSEKLAAEEDDTDAEDTSMSAADLEAQLEELDAPVDETDEEEELEDEEEEDEEEEDSEDEDSEDADEEEEESDEEEEEQTAADLSEWKSALQNATNELKELAKKVVGTRHDSAKGVLGEINAIIKDMSKLPSNPTNEQIESHQAYISQHDGIAAAEEFPGEFHTLSIREKLMKALDKAKKSAANA